MKSTRLEAGLYGVGLGDRERAVSWMTDTGVLYGPVVDFDYRFHPEHPMTGCDLRAYLAQLGDA